MLGDFPLDVFPLRCTAISPLDGGNRKRLCRGWLLRRDRETLICGDTDCRHEYVLVNGVPNLVSLDNNVVSSYNDELMVRAYAEMNFASFADPAVSVISASTTVESIGRTLLETSDLTGPFYGTLAATVMAVRPPDGLVADVACGMGRMAPELFARGWRGNYLGLDLSSMLILEADRILLNGGSEVRMPLDLGPGPRTHLVKVSPPQLDPRRARFVVADAQRIPLPPNTCAAVLALNLIDRVGDPVRIVRSLWASVKRGGYLVLADPFHWEGQDKDRQIFSLRRLANWLPAGGYELCDLGQEQSSVVFAVRRRESRRVVVYDDEVVVYRKILETTNDELGEWGV